jgi:pimeloyl-ACP methyl ester carboxylesterase
MTLVRTERNVDVDGLSVRYLEAGAGPAVVFIHGASAGSSAEVWNDFFEPLAGAGYRPIAYDQPGYGLTDNPTDFTNSYRAGFITKLMDTLAIDRATLVGHSQGGGFVLQTALEQPHRVAAVAVVSSGPLLPPLPDAGNGEAPERTPGSRSGDPSLDDIRKLLESDVFHKSLITQELVARRHRLSVGKNAVAAAERSRAREPRAGGKPAWEQLADLTQPLIMLYGENDRASAGKRARLLKEQQPQLDVRIVPDAAHMLMWDAPEWFLSTLLEFLAGVATLSPVGRGRGRG